jgi:hypothetical protein
MSDCQECWEWEKAQTNGGEWDDVTISEARVLVAAHHAEHDIGTQIADLADDAIVQIRVGKLREILGLDHRHVYPDPLGPEIAAVALTLGLAPHPDGSPHFPHTRRRCNPPDPGVIDEICGGCEGVVNAHVPCPHQQGLDHGALVCILCDYRFVARTGVIGEEGGPTLQEAADWAVAPGDTNRGADAQWAGSVAARLKKE